jgi:uncharacterized protein (TIGR04141 family)
MNRPKTKTSTLTVYLVKAGITRDEAILAVPDVLESQTVGRGRGAVGKIYYRPTSVHVPRWAAFFGESIDTSGFKTASTPAILIVRASGRVFAVAFGHARFMLEPGCYEENFGLRVTLNAVDPERVRLVDLRTLDASGRHAREQASRNIPILDFGIDVETDLLRGVAAPPQDGTLGKRLSGTDGLSVTAEVELSSLKDLLARLLSQFRKREYKKRFPWVDNVAEVRDRNTLEELDTELVRRIRERELDDVWLAVPDLIDWGDFGGFRYSTSDRQGVLEDIGFETYLEYVRRPTETLDLNTLRRHQVHWVSAASDLPREQWPIYRCIYAEIESRGNTFLLNNGKWFQVASTFMAEVNRSIARLPETTRVRLPEYDDEDESKYNLRVSRSDPTRIALMDQKNVQYGGGTNKIEFCDLYVKNKALVHVKRYGGSSVLSHLFSQAVVSANLFLADASFRKEVNRRLPSSHRFRDPDKRPPPGDYEIAFAVISEVQGKLRLPFFSRVTLRNAARQLRNFGFSVTCTKIPAAKAKRTD